MRTRMISTQSADYIVHVDGENPSLPTAVFLHGGPGFNSLGERRSLAGKLASSVNMLWFDALGCGESRARSPQSIGWLEQVDDIATIIREAAGGRAHVIGHCLGTPLTHELVRRHRGLVQG